ncbi:MAG TPA: molybdenum cofactor guanylyltransferase [Methanobacteriaceae archaeon]|nr:molybdenum cofactor guanylyltransferase [Methanobacteriaceae archaeon]
MKSCIVLCGGQGKRMGQDKGIMDYKDKPLILHTLKAVSQVADEIILVLRDENQWETYSSLLSSFKEYFSFKDKLKVCFDVEKDQGPLVGIYTGLINLDSDRVLVVPCDSPLINGEFVMEMLDIDLDGHGALVPRWEDGRVEPLHAVYYKGKTIPILKNLLKSSVRDVKSLLEKLDVFYVDAKSQNGDVFINLNYPEDLEELEQK